jgi:hypothetical protein
MSGGRLAPPRARYPGGLSRSLSAQALDEFGEYL